MVCVFFISKFIVISANRENAECDPHSNNISIYQASKQQQHNNNCCISIVSTETSTTTSSFIDYNTPSLTSSHQQQLSPFAFVTLVHCAQSVWPLHFLSETKITFLALSLFKYCKISLPFVIEKDELSVLFLNYTGFSSKHRRVRVLWGFIINFILTYFKIVCIYRLNFSFCKSRYRKRYSLDTLSHLHLCFKKLTFQNRHCHQNFT